MITVRSKVLFLVVCLVEVVWLLMAQILGNALFLMLCLMCFLALAIWAAIKGMAVPVLLFFLPFATLLKTAPGQLSFFTFALLAVYLICLVLGCRKINAIHVIPGLVLIVQCLVVKTLYGYQIENSYLLFSVSLLLVPFIVVEFTEKYDFFWLTLFFSVGIVIAAISSLYLTMFPTISRYIEHYELFGLVRHSGYYGDPNFYSAHVSAALSGVLILLINNTSKMRFILLILMMLALVYCGFLSVSKMFFLIFIFLLLFFTFEILFKKGKLSIKLLFILSFIIGIIFLLSSTVFAELVDRNISRLFGNTNFSDFTTGRTDIWYQYLRDFEENPLLLMFGVGCTGVRLNSLSSHNTIIQMVYQFGLVGSVFLVFWIGYCVRVYLSRVKIKWNNFAQICIILLGTIGPWMALDMLLFDEFFLMPMYVCLGIASITKKDAENVVISK